MSENARAVSAAPGPKKPPPKLPVAPSPLIVPVNRLVPVEIAPVPASAPRATVPSASESGSGLPVRVSAVRTTPVAKLAVTVPVLPVRR